MGYVNLCKVQGIGILCNIREPAICATFDGRCELKELKELCGYCPEGTLAPRPKRVEIGIDGWDLVAVPREEWMAILPLLTPEQWREIYQKVYAGK